MRNRQASTDEQAGQVALIQAVIDALKHDVALGVALQQGVEQDLENRSATLGASATPGALVRNPYMELMMAASKRNLPPYSCIFDAIQIEADKMAVELRKDPSIQVIQPTVKTIYA